MIADLWQDLRYGARLTMKNPGFTSIAMLTLGLGIGVNSALFTVSRKISGSMPCEAAYTKDSPSE